jgi:hypothetical protein
MFKPIQEGEKMNKLFKTLSFVAAIAFLATACIPPVVEVAQAAPAEVTYQVTLGKSVHDRAVTDFLASNNCARTGPFQLCKSAGIALWMDSDRIVKTAYLYVSAAEGFSAYRGELPLGLTAGDAMTDVERKLGYPKVDHAPQAGWEPGLPDVGRSPDHRYFWAIYERFGVTVIYDTPAANDKNATIHAILVSK